MDFLINILHLVCQALFLGLPAIVANTIPVPMAKLLPKWNTPMDFHGTYRGKRILGDHKTWRGFITGILAGIITIALQARLGQKFDLSWWQILDYTRPDLLLIGASLGFGALAGDAIKSFFKRQMDIPSGGPWFPWDQMDATIGATLCLLLFTFPGWPIILTGILAGPIVHFVANPIGYMLGIKKVWW